MLAMKSSPSVEPTATEGISGAAAEVGQRLDGVVDDDAATAPASAALATKTLELQSPPLQTIRAILPVRSLVTGSQASVVGGGAVDDERQIGRSAPSPVPPLFDGLAT